MTFGYYSAVKMSLQSLLIWLHSEALFSLRPCKWKCIFIRYYLLWGWVININIIMLQWNVFFKLSYNDFAYPKGNGKSLSSMKSTAFVLLLTWYKDRFTLNLRAVGADEPKLPRRECNYNVLRFLTSCVWVMGRNLNNPSFSYLERAALCAHSISRSFHVAMEEEVSTDCKRTSYPQAYYSSSLEENVTGICWELSYLHFKLNDVFYGNIQIWSAHLAQREIFTADQKRRAFHASYSLLWR